jgi:hypothetical protein
MVKWIADRTGRFRERPHYESCEIDNECERLVIKLLTKIRGTVGYPIITDDLEKLIEGDAKDLDMYADLSTDGPDVEGVTRFAFGRKPSVEISSALSEAKNRNNRLRTTLAHEFGHVHFHDGLFQMKMSATDLFSKPSSERIVCKRDKMVDAPVVDWLEWQACYASGAILMPKSATMKLVEEFRRSLGVAGTITSSQESGVALIALVRTRFDVSEEAARVRLTKLGVLSHSAPQPTLF